MNILRKIHSMRRRNQVILVLALSIFFWSIFPEFGNGEYLRPPMKTVPTLQPCVELRPEVERGPYQEAEVEKSGDYCLASDFWQRRLSDGAGHYGPAPYRHLLDVKGRNVVIDLRNHVLHSDGHSSGIIGSINEETLKYSDVKNSTLKLSGQITIKNGVIDLRGLGTGVSIIKKLDMRGIDLIIPEAGENYEGRSIILENLLIKTDNVAIKLEGNGNIIRNCVIESGGASAIMLAGPNGQIVNNSIILKNPFIPGSMRGVNFGEPSDFSELFEERRRPKAAIALHQASGTIISGNRIEVRGRSPTRHNIYLADASMDVRIEGNTFVGAEDPVTLVKGSTAILKNNVLEPRKPWWKF